MRLAVVCQWCGIGILDIAEHWADALLHCDLILYTLVMPFHTQILYVSMSSWHQPGGYCMWFLSQHISIHQRQGKPTALYVCIKTTHMGKKETFSLFFYRRKKEKQTKRQRCLSVCAATRNGSLWLTLFSIDSVYELSNTSVTQSTLSEVDLFQFRCKLARAAANCANGLQETLSCFSSVRVRSQVEFG